MISQDHVIKGSCDFMDGTLHGKSPPCKVWWPKAFGSGDMMLLVIEGQDSTFQFQILQ